MSRFARAQFVDGDGQPLAEVFGVRSRRLRPAAPEHSYLPSLADFEVHSTLHENRRDIQTIKKSGVLISGPAVAIQQYMSFQSNLR